MSQRAYQARLRHAGATIEPRCHIARGSRISRRTVFEYGAAVNGPAIFKGSQAIHIGRYAAIGSGVRMISSNHRTDVMNMHSRLQGRLGVHYGDDSRGPIWIGHNVWIGDAAIILSGVTIGRGSVIGAGSVVTKDIPPYSVAVGQPARVLRRRLSEDAIAFAEAQEWWNWSEDEMLQHTDFFASDWLRRV